MDWRVAEMVVMLKKPSKKSVKIELVPARLWPDKFKYGRGCSVPKTIIRDNLDGLYRLRIDGRWYKSAGIRYKFVTLHEAFEIMEEITCRI